MRFLHSLCRGWDFGVLTHCLTRGGTDQLSRSELSCSSKPIELNHGYSKNRAMNLPKSSMRPEMPRSEVKTNIRKMMTSIRITPLSNLLVITHSSPPHACLSRGGRESRLHEVVGGWAGLYWPGDRLNAIMLDERDHAAPSVPNTLTLFPGSIHFYGSSVFQFNDGASPFAALLATR